jgi:hypothetical protein
MTQEQIINKYAPMLSKYKITISTDGSLSGNTTNEEAAMIMSSFRSEYDSATKTNTNTSTTSTSTVQKFKFNNQNLYTNINDSSMTEWTKNNKEWQAKNAERTAGILTETQYVSSKPSDFDQKILDAKFNDDINKAVSRGDTQYIINLRNKFDLNNSTQAANWLTANEAAEASKANSKTTYYPKTAADVIIPNQIARGLVKQKPVEDDPLAWLGPLGNVGKPSGERTAEFNNFNNTIDKYKKAIFGDGSGFEIITKDGKEYAIDSNTYWTGYFAFAEKNPDKDFNPNNAENKYTFNKTLDSSYFKTEATPEFKSAQKLLGYLRRNFGITDLTKITTDTVPIEGTNNRETIYLYNGNKIDLASTSETLTVTTSTGEEKDVTAADIIADGFARKDALAVYDITVGDKKAGVDAELDKEQQGAINWASGFIGNWLKDNGISWTSDKIKEEATKFIGTDYTIDSKRAPAWFVQQYDVLEKSGVVQKYSKDWQDELKQGNTIRNLAGAYISQYADLYGLDPNSIDINDPLIQNAITIGKDGKMNMSLADMTVAAKRAPGWLKTEKGKQWVDNMAQGFGQLFGF